MKSTLVTLLNNNEIIGNYFFKNIEMGEKRFTEECLKLDTSLDSENLQDLLDDGYFVYDIHTVCINSFDHAIEPTNGVMFVANNCVDFITLHHDRYELKNSFKDIIIEHSSNGDDYTSEDIEQCMEAGYENINGSKVYYFKLFNN